MVAAVDQDLSDAAGTHFAERNFGGSFFHGTSELKSGHCTLGYCASGQLSLSWFLSLDCYRTDLHRYTKP
jgi:hypothetical protein